MMQLLTALQLLVMMSGVVVPVVDADLVTVSMGRHSSLSQQLAQQQSQVAADVANQQQQQQPQAEGEEDNSTAAKASADYVTNVATQWIDVRTEYSAPLVIGTPPQNLNVLFDTGSCALWVNASRFRSSDSSTFTDLGRPFVPDIEYVDGSKSTGRAVTDYVGASVDIYVKDFEFMLADYIVGPGSDSNDGIVGMSLQNKGYTTPTFMNMLIQQDALSTYQVSFYIDRSEDFGSVTFGGFDTSLLQDPTQSIDLHKVVDRSYHTTRTDGKVSTFTDNGKFALPLLGIQVGEDNSPTTFTTKKGALFDTGTSNGRLPQSVLDSIQSATGATLDASSRLLRLPCASVPSAPTLFFILQSLTLTLMAEDYFVTDPYDSESCLVWFNAFPDDTQDVLFGNTFLKRYLTVFDYKQQAIGFGLAKGRTPYTGNLPTLAMSFLSQDGSAAASLRISDVRCLLFAVLLTMIALFAT